MGARGAYTGKQINATAHDLGTSWGVAMSGREIDRSQSIYYYNSTLITCDPQKGPNTPAPPPEIILQQAQALARSQQSAAGGADPSGVPNAAIKPNGSGPCLSASPLLAQATADSVEQLLQLSSIPDPCFVEITLTGPSRYALSGVLCVPRDALRRRLACCMAESLTVSLL